MTPGASEHIGQISGAWWGCGFDDDIDFDDEPGFEDSVQETKLCGGVADWEGFDLGGVACEARAETEPEAERDLAGVAQSVAIGAVVSAASTLIKVTIETEGDLGSADWDSIMTDYAINLGVSALGASLGAGLHSMTGKGGGPKSYSYTDKDGNTYNYRELNAQEQKMHQEALGRVKALEGDYAPIKNIGDAPVYRLESATRNGQSVNVNDVNEMVNINGKDNILLGGNAFKNSDNFTHGLLSEFQHMESGFGLSDRDFVGPTRLEGKGIAQMQVNHMAKQLGMDPSKMPLHGGLRMSERATIPSSPVQAYRRNGVLYHNLQGSVFDSKVGRIQRDWPGWP